MSFIISNFNSRSKTIVSTEEMPGKLLYQGHMLGVPDELLDYIIYYTHEKFSGNFYFLDYKKWNDNYNMRPINSTMTKCWIKNKDNLTSLRESYSSLIETLQYLSGKVRKIYIIET